MSSVDYSTFENTVDSINSLLINEFIRKFQDEDGNCSSDRIVKQAMQLKIQANPGEKIDLAKCSLSINQTIDLKGKKIVAGQSLKLEVRAGKAKPKSSKAEKTSRTSKSSSNKHSH